MDLPFAQSRFCTTEGLPASYRFRPSEARIYPKLRFTDCRRPHERLVARAVIVVDEKGIVRHTQLVKEISQEPDYEAALESAATATTE